MCSYSRPITLIQPPRTLGMESGLSGIVTTKTRFVGCAGSKNNLHLQLTTGVGWISESQLLIVNPLMGTNLIPCLFPPYGGFCPLPGTPLSIYWSQSNKLCYKNGDLSSYSSIYW